MPFLNKRGFALAATVMLIMFASIVVSGRTIFVVQCFSHTTNKQTDVWTNDLAQAHVHEALYNFRLKDLTGNGIYRLNQTNSDTNRFSVKG